MIYISIIAAIAKNGVIGFQGKLPWKIPDDLAYFQQVTLNHPVIMGRYTFESIGKPLPQRSNIILSRSAYNVKGVISATSRTEALNIATKICQTRCLNEIFIIGGSQIYTEFMPLAHKLYITKIFKKTDGDRYFPSIDRRRWALVWEKYIEQPIPHAYQRYERLNLP